MLDGGEPNHANIQGMPVQRVDGEDNSEPPLGSKGNQIDLSTPGMNGEVCH
jgi:hypothetical protein